LVPSMPNKLTTTKAMPDKMVNVTQNSVSEEKKSLMLNQSSMLLVLN